MSLTDFPGGTKEEAFLWAYELGQTKAMEILPRLRVVSKGAKTVHVDLREELPSLLSAATCRVLAAQFVEKRKLDHVLIARRKAAGLPINNTQSDPVFTTEFPGYTDYAPSVITADELLRALLYETRLILTVPKMRNAYKGSQEAMPHLARQHELEHTVTHSYALDPWVLDAGAELHENFGVTGVVYLASLLSQRPLRKVFRQLGLRPDTMDNLAYNAMCRRLERDIKKHQPAMHDLIVRHAAVHV